MLEYVPYFGKRLLLPDLFSDLKCKYNINVVGEEF